MRLLPSILVLSAAPAFAAIEPPPTPAQLEFFEKNIRPVLAEKCYKCHSASEKIKGGLTLDTREGIRTGGDTGRAVVPGNPKESVLLTALRWEDKDLQMPPQKEGGKLPDAVIANFEQWIAMGAPDPRVKTVVAGANSPAGNGQDFWPAKPPVKAAVPVVKDKAWPRTDIDRFILAGLESRGLKPVADSDPRALLRRVHCDLTGMPPSVETVDWFAKECAKGEAARQAAFTAIVDKLLQSPRFGERWGRHWLDVARYAESTGREQNQLYPTAWRYRDYVVTSFNADKPYDQFIREQIAGDLLPAATPAERNQHQVATAFLAMGVKALAEKDRIQFTMDQVDDQIDATSRAVLGLTVACARCHNHKYDPITVNDYYGLASIFRSTETLYGTEGKKGRNAAGFAPLVDEVTGKLPADPVPNAAAVRNARVAAIRPGPNAAQQKKAARNQPVVLFTPQELQHKTMGVREGAVRDYPIYVRGEVDQAGPVAPRSFVKVLGTPAAPIPANASGRLQLAQWLTTPQNPMTARVMVNRVWENLFGQGIVRTADNFGTTGERPTHPELLDDLSVRFMQEGWSVKKLVREIVLSRAYQLSTVNDSSNREIDPDNRYCWRANPRRLDAETIRDAMLTASGLMDLKPPGGSMVASIGSGLARPYADEFTNAQFHYRSIYLPIVRDFVPACLQVFDFAEPSLVVAARGTTNVPSQALYLMNDPFVLEQSQALAKRFPATSGSDRLALIYRAALCRPPSDAERARANDLLQAQGPGMTALNRGDATAAREDSWVTLCQALFASAEFRYLADVTPNSPKPLP